MAQANGYLREVDKGGGLTFDLVASPVQHDEVSPPLDPAPEHGQHTEEILLELGIEWDEIARGKDSGAVL
jgi:crotonobetainyl-CoA:carnitine CoA-transferase CaiB-like acyl-CoA transferase